MKRTCTKATAISTMPKNEYGRVLELSKYDVDLSENYGSMNDLAELATIGLGAKAALINLIDSFFMKPIASFGIHQKSILRNQSVGQFTILEEDYFEIPDLMNDDRTKRLGFIKQADGLSYYFGIPLTTQKGFNIGEICVLNDQNLSINKGQLQMFRIIARQVMQLLDSYSQINILHHNIGREGLKKRKLNHDIRGPLGGIIGLVDICREQEQEKENSDQLVLLEMIKKSSNALLKITDGILPKQKPDSNILKTHDLTLLTLKEKIEKVFDPIAKEKGIDLIIATIPNNEKMPFPRSKLLQVWEAVLGNAIFLSAEQGLIMLRMECLPTSKNGFLYFTLKVASSGVSEAEVRIIEHWSEESSVYMKEKHRIVGFMIARQLINAMDGEMKFILGDEDGLTVEVKIPISK